MCVGGKRHLGPQDGVAFREERDVCVNLRSFNSSTSLDRASLKSISKLRRPLFGPFE